MKIKTLICGATLGLFVGCGYNVMNTDEQSSTANGKADEFVTTIKSSSSIKARLGTESLSGVHVGTSVLLYRIVLKDAVDNDLTTLKLNIKRIDGSVEPQAFLFKNLDDMASNAFLPPDEGYTYGKGALNIEWKLDEGGAYFLAVKAYRDGAGTIELSLNCEGNLCDPNEVDPLANFDSWMKLAQELPSEDWESSLGAKKLDCFNAQASNSNKDTCTALQQGILSMKNIPDLENGEKNYFSAIIDGNVAGYAASVVSYDNCPENCDPADDCGVETCDEHIGLVFLDLNGKITKVNQ